MFRNGGVVVCMHRASKAVVSKHQRAGGCGGFVRAADSLLTVQMVLNGHIYRGRKPVHWSPSSRTALAEAELEYPEGHKSKSIYVALPLCSAPPSASQELKDALSGAALSVWTTTPWTMPANMAVAVNEELQYSVVQVRRVGGVEHHQRSRCRRAWLGVSCHHLLDHHV